MPVLQISSTIRQKYSWVMQRIIRISLFFLFVCVPLIINPFVYDVWYKPRINSVYALIVIIIIAVTIRHLCLNDPLRFKSIPLVIPLFAYAASAIISTVFSVAPELSLFGYELSEEGIFTLLAYVTLTILFSQLVETEKQYQALMKGILFSSLLISLNGILNYGGYYPIKQLLAYEGSKGPAVGSFIGNPNSMGKYLVLILPLFVAYYFTAKTIAVKIYHGVGFLLCLCALILTFTRGSWLGFLVGLASFLLFASRKIIQKNKIQIYVSMLVVCIVLSISFCAFLSNEKGEFIDYLKERIYSAFDLKEGKGVTTRLFVWRKTIGIIQERPLVGYGPDTHIKAMQKMNYEYCFKYNDWTLVKEGEKRIVRFYNWTIIDRAHNNYLDIAIGQGLIGLAAYMSIIITFLIWLWRTAKYEESISKRIIFCGIFASFCGYLLNDLFAFSVVSVSPTFWSLMGLTIAMKKIDKKNNENVLIS